MEFQSKNFRLGIGLFAHAAYAAHVAVIEPGLPSQMNTQEFNRHKGILLLGIWAFCPFLQQVKLDI